MNAPCDRVAPAPRGLPDSGRCAKRRRRAAATSALLSRLGAIHCAGRRAALRGIVDDDAETESLLPSSESKRAPPTRSLPWWVAAALGLLGVIGLIHLLGRAPHEPADADAPGEDGVAALAKTTEALEAEAFWAAKATRRQMAAFAASCGCTRALLQEYAERYRTRARVLVIDGSGFR